ncbi:hypothetical protein [Flavobacterium sp. CF136]|nr:hypothetical protein [Flavobacterium sp. CF136]
MKQVRYLLIAFIGMMFTTVTANTTAKLEEKQKIESVSYETGFEIKQPTS